jgi:hypothetical protein
LIKLHGVQIAWRSRLEAARSSELSQIAKLRYLEAGATLVCALLAQVRDIKVGGIVANAKYTGGGLRDTALAS